MWKQIHISLYQGRICEELKPCIDYDYCVATSTTPWYECKCKTPNPCQNKGQCIQPCLHVNCTCNCSSSYFGKYCEIHEEESIHYKTQHLNHTAKEITVKNADSLTACMWFNAEHVLRGVALFTLNSEICGTFSVFIKKGLFALKVLDDVFQYVYDFTECKWYHLCITWKNRPSISLYINGMENNNLYFSYYNSINFLNAKYIVVGQDTNYIQGSCQVNIKRTGFIGKIAMLNIWDKELNSSEVQQVYEGTYTKGNIVKWSMFK